MEVKIKQGNEMLDATIEMIGGVMVVSPKEVKFEPKDGDVLSYMNNDKPTIYVYREGGDDITTYYVAYSSVRDEVLISNMTDVLYRFIDNVRYATEEEKKKLFDKLAEEGYEWNAETKKLVKLKWKPKVDETCFLPRFDFPKFIAKQWLWEINGFSTYHYNEGWVFRTKEECQKFCNRLNDAINSIKP